MPGLHPSAWILIAGVLLLFPLQGYLDRHQGPEPELSEVLPPERLLPALAFGHGETLSDLLEVKATNYLMGSFRSRSRLERRHLVRLYNAIISLDKNNVDACWRGAVYLASAADDPEGGLALLRRGLGEDSPSGGASGKAGAHPAHPRRWRLPYEQAAITFLMLSRRARDPAERDALVREAGHLWIQAASFPGAPPFLEVVGARLAKRGLSPREALRLEARLWEERSASEDPLTQARAQRRFLEAQSALRALDLQARVDGQAARGARLAEGALLDVAGDPLGIGYLLREGKVIPLGVEAAQLERRLSSWFHTWRKTHPGQEPSLEDLEVKAPLPDYLRVSISPRGVKVEPLVGQ